MKAVTTAEQIEAVRALARATRVLERASGELSLAHYRVLAAVDGDQRVAVLHLTPEGRALLARVEAEMIRRIDELCARTPDPGRLMESLVWLGAAIDDWQAQRAADRRAE